MLADLAWAALFVVLLVTDIIIIAYLLARHYRRTRVWVTCTTITKADQGVLVDFGPSGPVAITRIGKVTPGVGFELVHRVAQEESSKRQA
jgi:hypothetical protein